MLGSLYSLCECVHSSLVAGLKGGVGRGGGSNTSPGAVGTRVPLGVSGVGDTGACTVGCARNQLHVRFWNSH